MNQPWIAPNGLRVDADMNAYTRRQRFPKWNTEPNTLMEYRLMRRMPEFRGWSKVQHVSAALQWAYVAAVAVARHQHLLRIGETAYGTDGALIAGGFREHWPDDVKDQIRAIARYASFADSASLAHWRTAGRTDGTWRKMKQSAEVA